MRRASTIAFKDLKILLRDRAALFWVLAFPLLLGILFGSIFGGPESQSASKLAVVDDDKSPEAANLVTRLRTSPAVSVELMPVEAAREAVRKGDVAAYLVIPEGYGEADRKFQAGEVPLRLGTDPSRKAEIGILEGVISQAAYAGLQERFADPEQLHNSTQEALKDIETSEMSPNEKTALTRLLQELDLYSMNTPPGSAAQGKFGLQGPTIKTVSIMEARKGPTSAYEISFPQALLWGLLGVVSTFAVSIVRERTQGTMLRLRCSPASFLEILGGKGLACFIACVGVMTVLLSFGIAVFGIRVSSPVNLLLAIVATGVCFVGIMMLLSVLGKTEQAVGGSSWGVLIILAMFGGAMLPVFVMPGWMQAVSNFSPLKWSVLSIEGAIWRGFTLQEMLLPLGILVGVGAVCFAIGVRILAKRTD